MCVCVCVCVCGCVRRESKGDCAAKQRKMLTLHHSVLGAYFLFELWSVLLLCFWEEKANKSILL